MTKIIAILSATLMSSAAFAAPAISDLNSNAGAAPVLMAQAASNDDEAGESPSAPVVDEEEGAEGAMGTTTGPDTEQAENDDMDGDSPSAPIVTEEEQMEGETGAMTTGPDADQAGEEDLTEGESDQGAVVDEAPQ